MSVMTCQMALYPLNTTASSRVIAEILAQMDWQGVDVQVGSMSTVIRGEEQVVWEKVRSLYTLAAQEHRIVLNLAVSNECGC
ncbi:hypothetical protein D2Q93_14675 [Alicyclobacillaceae bacterium I2511]|nr:hypothetical protein D2Q93_14675 [Alicyclobacillaceae bacterium I2511]